MQLTRLAALVFVATLFTSGCVPPEPVDGRDDDVVFTDLKLGFHKIAKNYYYPGWWEPGWKPWRPSWACRVT